MAYSSDLAEIRFGCGLSPVIAPPELVQAVLDGLAGPDRMAAAFPVEPFSLFWRRFAKVVRLRKQQRAARGTPQEKDFNQRAGALIKRSNADADRGFAQAMLRWVQTRQGLRERLVFFWADHFTALGKNASLRPAGLSYVEQAIRPNLTGRFGDLLTAVVMHPMMLHYLDQSQSIGPGSPAAARAKRPRGLNENLAREVLELHTLGVDGPYSQTDVRQLAELFTGLALTLDDGFVFRGGLAEPGPETVLGRTYGGGPAAPKAIRAALQDLAVHPATARHIAAKLAVHFVADRPDPALVDHIAGRWRETGGDLSEVYAALLEHPAAWQTQLRNVKPPVDFMASACRALAVTPERIGALPLKALRARLKRPLAQMGQPWLRPFGPDGWPEEDAAWISPQGLAMRLRWSLAVPGILRPDLPDPRRFVEQALGGYASPAARFAADAAESRAEAIALVLASPGFQRR